MVTNVQESLTKVSSSATLGGRRPNVGSPFCSFFFNRSSNSKAVLRLGRFSPMSEGFHDLRISLGTSPLLERILTEGRTASPALPSVVTFGQIIITTDGRSAHVGLQLASRLTVDLRSKERGSDGLEICLIEDQRR